MVNERHLETGIIESRCRITGRSSFWQQSRSDPPADENLSLSELSYFYLSGVHRFILFESVSEILTAAFSPHNVNFCSAELSCVCVCVCTSVRSLLTAFPQQFAAWKLSSGCFELFCRVHLLNAVWLPEELYVGQDLVTFDCYHEVWSTLQFYWATLQHSHTLTDFRPVWRSDPLNTILWKWVFEIHQKWATANESARTWQSPDTSVMSGLRVCSSRVLSRLRALFHVEAWCSDPGTHVLSFGYVTGFTRAPRSVCLCECACIRVISCAVWHAACIFIGCVLSCCHVLCEHVAYEFSH